MARIKIPRNQPLEWVAENARRRHVGTKVVYTGNDAEGRFIVVTGHIIEFRRHDLRLFDRTDASPSVTDQWKQLALDVEGEIVYLDSMRFILCDPGYVARICSVERRSLTLYPTIDAVDGLEFWAAEVHPRQTRNQMVLTAIDRYLRHLRVKHRDIAPREPKALRRKKK